MRHLNPWVGDEWVEASVQLVIEANGRELIWDLGVFEPTDEETYTLNRVEERLHRAVGEALDSGFLSTGDEVLLRIGPRERRFRIALRPDGRYRLEEQHRRLRSGTTERRRRTYFPNPQEDSREAAQRAALGTWLFRSHRALLSSRAQAAKSRQLHETLGAIGFAGFAGIISDVERIRLTAWVKTGQWERSTAEIEFLDPPR